MNDFDINEAAPFDTSLPMMLYRVLDAIMPAYRSLFAEYGLTEQQWRVMRTLWEVESLSSIEVARRTLLPAASLVGVLDRLERKGMIARLRSVEDRRVVFAKLTPEGRALGEEILPRIQPIQNELRARVTPAEWALLSELLTKFEGAPKPAATRNEDERHA